MIKIFIAWVVGMFGTIALGLAIISGLDYIADGFTIFTEPGVWFIRAAVAWLLTGCVTVFLAWSFFSDDNFFSRFMNGNGKSRGIISSMRSRIGLD